MGKRNSCNTTAYGIYNRDYCVNLCPDNEVVIGGYMYQHKITRLFPEGDIDWDRFLVMDVLGKCWYKKQPWRGPGTLGLKEIIIKKQKNNIDEAIQ